MAAWLDRRAATLSARGLTRRARVRIGLPGGGGMPVDLASNDYLGLARDPRVQAAAIGAVDRFGAGARASRLVTGTLPPHEECEAELAALLGQPAALVLSSGYLANLAAVTSLTGPDCLLVTDEHVHASIVDAARLARAPRVIVPHGDLDAVEDTLARRAERRALVVVESVYSVLGDAADLRGLAEVCARHDAILLVDEAHGVGVLGHGRGGVHAAGLSGTDHVYVTATLSKALGAQGGAVLGPVALRRHLVDGARSFIFDTGLAPAAAAAAAEACRIVTAEPERVARIRERALLVSEVCGVEPTAGAVQSVPMPSAEAAVDAVETLEGRGVLVGCFRPPSVPDGISRLRICADAGLPRDVVADAAREVAAVVDHARLLAKESVDGGRPRPGPDPSTDRRPREAGTS